MAKLGKQTEVTITEDVLDKDGKKTDTVDVVYKLQHPGVKKATEILDATIVDGSGKTSITTMYEEYMKHVIVEPKTDWDYWEEHEGMQKVMGECATFLNG